MTTIKEIPLLFQTEMVKAILAGIKTQTRRTQGLEGLDNCYFQSLVHHVTGHFTFVEIGNYSPKNEDVKVAKSPYGKPGDLLWVRETYLKLYTDHTMDGNPYYYKASFGVESEELRQDYIRAGYDYKWKPSIHMPKAACRIWLMVEEIRLERLQEISEEDAIAEGVEVVKVKGSDGTFYKHYNVTGELKKIADANNADPLTIHPVSSFQSLWESINGWESWNQNPWVWVVKFRVLSTTGRPSDDIILQHHKSITGATTADLPSSVSGLPSPITP